MQLADNRDFTPVLAKSKLGTIWDSGSVVFNESKALSDSYGAVGLLYKMNLYIKVICSIRRRHPGREVKVPVERHKRITSGEDLTFESRLVRRNKLTPG